MQFRLWGIGCVAGTALLSSCGGSDDSAATSTWLPQFSAVQVSASSIEFGDNSAYTTSPAQEIKLANSGTIPVTIADIAVSGTNADSFSLVSQCGTTLAVGGSCSVAIVFSPATAGVMSATLTIVTSAAANTSVALSGNSTPAAAFPPYPAADIRVILDIGVTALNPRNTWEALPTGFALGQIAGAAAGTMSDTLGFTPNSGGYIENGAAYPDVDSSQGTIYMRLPRAALAADNSADAGATFYDSTGNTTGGYGAEAAAAFTLYDGTNNIIDWAMGEQPTSGLQILDAGSWLYPGAKANNSHSPAKLDPLYADIVLTWQGATYWAYFDGTPIAYGTFPTALPATGVFSQVVIGGYLNGFGNVGHPLGPFSIQRFQISTAYSPPPALSSEPLIGFYGDSFVVQGGGVSGDIPGTNGSPTFAQVNSVQTQLDQTTSPNAYGGFNGQDGFASRVQAYAQQLLGGYVKLYTAAQSGHGWAYSGMGGTTGVDTPAIDDFALGKTGYSDALDAALPDYIIAFGSVNDVNNGTPADIVGDYKTHLDYWANNNANLKGIYYIETLSWELATGASTSHGGPAAWKAEMARQRDLLRAAYSQGYLAGTRQVPVTYIKTYETWVQGPNSARFLIASNPDNQSQSSNIGSSPNGHPDAEGNIQIVDAYIWPILTQLLH